MIVSLIINVIDIFIMIIMIFILFEVFEFLYLLLYSLWEYDFNLLLYCDDILIVYEIKIIVG